mmetsp:Transcript_38741/g.95322  ORF Transcript_38741/g.95322 Transcript_38741/m.95322 type:complete len:266 (-) Transcript_38741:2087-2884(-)
MTRRRQRSSRGAPALVGLRRGRGLGGVGLVARDDDGVDDVLDGAPAAEVVHREPEALHDGPDGDAPRRLLHGLVRVVPRVEVGEDAHVGAPQHAALLALHLYRSHVHINSRVELRGPLDGQIRRKLLGHLRSLADLVDHGASVALPSSIAQHRHARLDPEGSGRSSAAQRDLAQVLARGVHIDGAVGEEVHAVRKEHKEARRHKLRARRRLDDLKGRAHRVGGGVARARDHAVALAKLDHHRGVPRVVVVEELPGHREGEALLRA